MLTKTTENCRQSFWLSFEVSYRAVENEKLSREELDAFGKVNAVFNSWPYWRELVHSSFSRMSIPNFIMPLLRVNELVGAEQRAD